MGDALHEAALKFNEEPYAPETLAAILSEFRENGYARLPDVFERATVDGFREELLRVACHDGLKLAIPDDSPSHIRAPQAPRIRQVLPRALSHSVANPLPCLYITTWLIHPEGVPGLEVKWHKDREPDGMAGKEYHYPEDVFVGIYFEDMEEDGKGPSRIIPGSHRDLSLSPFSGAAQQSIFCRKEDAFLLDQRSWHRGIPRTAPGPRVLAIHGFFPVPFHYSFPFTMPAAQKAAWIEARSAKDRAFWGGIFAPPAALLTRTGKQGDG